MATNEELAVVAEGILTEAVVSVPTEVTVESVFSVITGSDDVDYDVWTLTASNANGGLSRQIVRQGTQPTGAEVNDVVTEMVATLNASEGANP